MRARFSDDLFDHLLSKDMQGFWKVWAYKTCKSVISVDSIDGKTDDLEIANAFRDSLNICSNMKNSIDVDFIQDCDRSFLPWKLNVESVDKVFLII